MPEIGGGGEKSFFIKQPLSFPCCSLCLFFFLSFSAVQQERKPPDSEKKLPTTMATSTQRIYIRKDLNSPAAAIPNFTNRISEIEVNASSDPANIETLL